MRNPSIKKSLQAFLMGGIVGAVTQGFLTIYLMFVSDFGLAVSLSLFTLGVLGGILTAVGIFGKLDKFGGMGVNVPTFGLGAAVTGSILASRAGGKPIGRAVVEGLVPPLKLLGTAAVIGFIGAIVKYFMG